MKDGAEQVLHIEGKAHPVKLPCHGVPCLKNALAAAAAALAMGATVTEIVEGLESYHPIYMRLCVIPLSRGIHLIDDSYNANPVSTAAALETLRQLSTGRTIAVLGDMLELGPETVEAHRSVGKSLSDYGVDVLIGVGPLAEHYLEGAAEGASPPSVIEHAASTGDAAKMLIETIEPGDWILIKGSRGMVMERIVHDIKGRFAERGKASDEAGSA